MAASEAELARRPCGWTSWQRFKARNMPRCIRRRFRGGGCWKNAARGGSAATWMRRRNMSAYRNTGDFGGEDVYQRWHCHTQSATDSICAGPCGRLRRVSRAPSCDFASQSSSCYSSGDLTTSLQVHLPSKAALSSAHFRALLIGHLKANPKSK